MTPYHCDHIRYTASREGLLLVGFFREASGHELFTVPGIDEGAGRVGVTMFLPTIAGKCVDCGAEYGWREQEAEA